MFGFKDWIKNFLANLMFFYHTGNLYFAGRKMGRLLFTVKCFCLLGLFFLTAARSGAQFYDKGQEPGYLKWEQIRTKNFRVIFPEDFNREANRMAHILESYYEPNAAYLNHRPKPISVVLHNHSVLSNGFVAWAPKRMEVVTTPSPTSYSQDHLEQLALHEFRHVVQVDKLRQGFTRGLSYVIGEAGIGAVAGLLPFWYLEGDATDAETRLSYSGRGRLPSFEIEMKAIVAQPSGFFHYEKAIFGSYKDFVPDHYRIGYQMVAHGRNKYGNELWDNVVTFTARKPFTLYPNYFGLKKYAGLSKVQLYQETYETLKNHWGDQAGKREYTANEQINRIQKNHYTSYRFPRYLNDSVIFAEKSGIDQIQEFIAIDRAGNEKRIHRPGFYDAANISVASNKIVWAEVMYDIRWERRSYSVIKIYDIQSKQERFLRMKTRYFAPDISDDGNFIAAIEADEHNNFFLVILHSNTGDVIAKVESPGNKYLQYPVWSDEHSRVYLTHLGQEGKKIMCYDLTSEEWSTIFDAGFEDIAELSCRGNFLVFRGGFSGIDNIYAVNLESLNCQRVTSSRFGAYTPCLSANGDTLIYADYTSQGFDLVRMKFEPSKFTDLGKVLDHNEHLNGPTSEEELHVPEPGNPEKPFESKKYRKGSSLFNFHSWAPLYVDLENPSIENLDVNPGLMLMSQNLLSTATTVLGYEYNLKEKDHFLHASFTYSGWYPELIVGFDYGGLPFVGPPPDSSGMLSEVRTDMSVRTKVNLPLNFTYNRYVMGMIPSAEVRYSRTYFYYNESNAYHSGLTFLDYRMYFYTHLKRGKRDILPRFGGILDLRYVNTPFEDEQLGSQTYTSAILYIPGILPHQTLRVFAGKQKQDPENYLMGNLLSMPRGIHSHTAIELTKYTFDYVFPLGYPDWQVWRAAYFKRFRGSVFYDYAIGKDVYIHNSGNDPIDKDFMSLGLELTTDVHLAQIFVPFNIGGRFIYIPETGETTGEFIFSVDLSQF
jgi:Tol biopolymer transport system component